VRPTRSFGAHCRALRSGRSGSSVRKIEDRAHLLSIVEKIQVRNVAPLIRAEAVEAKASSSEPA